MTPTARASETAASVALAAAHPAFVQARAGDPAWLKTRRHESLERFLTQGLPTRRDESWKYTSVRPFASLAFAPTVSGTHATVPPELLAPHIEADDVTLVYVDGVLSLEHSRFATLPDGLSITPLLEAAVKNQALVERLLARGEHPAAPEPTLAPVSASVSATFAELSDAFLRDGVVLEIGRGKTLARRVHLLHVATGSSPSNQQATAHFPRHLIAVGENAEATLVETFLGAGDHPYLVNAVSSIDLAAGARLRHARVQIESLRGFHIGRLNATLAKDSSLSTLSLSAGARLARIDIDVALTGPGSHVGLDGLYLTKGEQHVDHHTTVDHRVPDASSAQLYKGVLGDQSRAVFNGKVIVRLGAQRTNAQQLNRNLLLSAECEIDTKPELAIDADDVKCSHGAAVGPLRQDQLFYLTSRGLTRPESVRLLSAAFADEVLLKDTVPGLGQRLRPLTQEFFK